MTKRPPQKSKKRSTKPLSIKTTVTSLELARRFILEIKSKLPEGMFAMLDGGIRSRNTSTLRRAEDKWAPPQLYGSSESYFPVAQAFALLQKVPYPFGGGDDERRAVALKKFQFSETLCRITTRKLDYYWHHSDREDPLMRRILMRARGHVDRVLGDPDRGLNSIISESRFGPGMTVCSDDSARTTPYYKLGQKVRSVTSSATYYVNRAIMQSPTWTEQTAKVIDVTNGRVSFDWNTVTSCRLTFVPKDERSFRTIAIEPYGNVLVQLGVHEYLTKRLRTYAGIDIKDQTVNQKLAEFGSRNWLSLDTCSTIDLSSASDCVSPGLISRLVRPQWKAMLDDLRTKFYSLDGIEYPLSKWSSMGNGYTFALETLLFWALAQACEDVCNSGFRTKVYGDDIISSKSTSLLTMQVLRYCGFRVNLAKSFVVGPFRESCGADFHTGVAVRPIFLKSYTLKVPDVYRILNTFDPKAQLVSAEWYLSLFEALPRQFRLFSTPDGTVDTCINVSYSWLRQTRPKGIRYNSNNQCLFARRLMYKPSKFAGQEDVKYLTWLYNLRGANRTSLFEKVVGKPFSTSLIDDVLGSPTQVAVTQRDRGVFRFSSARVQHHAGPEVEWYHHLT